MTRPHALLLAGCLLLAAALRAPWLDRLPGPLHPDEAQDAVHARELLARPALSFPHEAGGWDEGTYVWLAAPCVAAAEALGWPPVEAAVRLPALVAGLALVPALYLLARDATPRVALLVPLLVALTPWAVHLSRLALRAALVPPLVALGLWCLDRASRQASPPAGDLAAGDLAAGDLAAGDLAAGGVAAPCAGAGRRAAACGGLLLALAAATYTPARLVVPLLALVWLATSRPRLAPRQSALALGPLALVFVALLPWTLTGQGGQRLGQVLALEREAGLGEHAARAARGWALHLSTRFLFSGASSRGFAPEGVGLLPLALAPLLLAGLARAALGAWRREPHDVRLLAWLALAPLAAALTRDVPNALRDVLALPALLLLAARGADALVARAARAARHRAGAATLALATLVIAGAAPPLWRYAREHPAREAAFYYAGRRELAREVGARAAAGAPVRVRGEFVAAYLRLYAPETPLRREGPDLVAGAGAPRWEVVVEREGARWRGLPR